MHCDFVYPHYSSFSSCSQYRGIEWNVLDLLEMVTCSCVGLCLN